MAPTRRVLRLPFVIPTPPPDGSAEIGNPPVPVPPADHGGFRRSDPLSIQVSGVSYLSGLGISLSARGGDRIMGGSDVYTGTLDMLILRALRLGPLHGYGIGRWIRDTSGDVLRIDEGALYPALHRLEKRRHVTARWGETELGRQAKFYRLTASGRKALAREEARWRRHVTAVDALLSADGN